MGAPETDILDGVSTRRSPASRASPRRRPSAETWPRCSRRPPPPAPPSIPPPPRRPCPLSPRPSPPCARSRGGLDDRVADPARPRRGRRAPAGGGGRRRGRPRPRPGSRARGARRRRARDPRASRWASTSLLFNDSGRALDVEAIEIARPRRLDDREARGRDRAAPRGRRPPRALRGHRRPRRPPVAALLAAREGPRPERASRPRGRDAPLEPTRPRRPRALPDRRRGDDARCPGRVALRGALRGRRAPLRGPGRAGPVGAGLPRGHGGAPRGSPPAGRGARLRPELRPGASRGERAPRSARGLVGRARVRVAALRARRGGGGRAASGSPRRASSTPARSPSARWPSATAASTVRRFRPSSTTTSSGASCCGRPRRVSSSSMCVRTRGRRSAT